jgi:hypothetical protein
MNYKLTISERGKIISFNGRAIRTPVEMILSESQMQLVLSQMKQLEIIQYTCEAFSPKEKNAFSVKKSQPEVQKDQNKEKPSEIKPKSLLQKLAEGEVKYGFEGTNNKED